MNEEEPIGVPPTEVMRQLLDENRALVRLVRADSLDHAVHGSEPEPCAETKATNALISAYENVLALVEILSLTSAAGSGEEVPGQ